MSRLKRILLFISLFLLFYILRFVNLDSPLPPSWTAESRISFTARIIDIPEQSDSKTIIKYGLWLIRLKGNQSLELGKTYKFVGKVKPQVLLGKIYKIEMMDPTFEQETETIFLRPTLSERLLITLAKSRGKMVERIQKLLPEPHASLSAGILLGVKSGFSYTFYQQLIKSGTLHIVAASGYNVNVVATCVMSVLLPWVGKGMAISIGILAIVMYILLAGSSVAVVRAGIMGILAITAQYLGRPVLGKRIFWITIAWMLAAEPMVVTDVGFWLSITAMGGLLYLQPWIEGQLKIKNVLTEYFYPTLAATIATAPVTFLFFGRIAGWGLISNVLILPLVPLTMALSALSLVATPASYLLYVPVEIMVVLIRIFG